MAEVIIVLILVYLITMLITQFMILYRIGKIEDDLYDISQELESVTYQLEILNRLIPKWFQSSKNLVLTLIATLLLSSITNYVIAKMIRWMAQHLPKIF